MKKQTVDFQAIYDQALAAGQKAEADYIETVGEDNYCGFAWVEIPNIWRCTNNMTQCMNVLEVGASAFAGVLKENGIDAWYNSRAD